MNIIKSVASLREVRTKFSSFSAMRKEAAEANLAKVKAEAEAVDKKIRGEYVEVMSQLSAEKEKTIKLESAAAKAAEMRTQLESRITSLEAEQGEIPGIL